MGKLIDKLIRALGGYTADDVEHIEKHWKERLELAVDNPPPLRGAPFAQGGQNEAPRRQCHGCINYGWGMPQCRECNIFNGWKHYQPEPK